MTFGRCLALALAAAGIGSHAQDSPQPRIELIRLGDSHAFAVLQLDAALLRDLTRRPLGRAAWGAIFQVRPDETAAGTGDRSRPAMLASFRVEADRVLLLPRFPIEPGLAYRARFDLGELARATGTDAETGSTITARLSIEAPEVRSTTRVVHVYPSAERLPENLLKFYLHFSAPMSSRGSYRHIRLLDSQEREIELPFLEPPQELWDPEGRRLTLLLDPGRIKRDLVPNRDVGPPLRPDEVFALQIDSAWLDTNGAPLAEGHIKRFSVVEADRSSPNPDAWVISPPAPGGREPLRVRFDEPLDHALSLRMLGVTTAGGQPVRGQPHLASEEQGWLFLPAQPWTTGRYDLQIDPRLEDLAGNAVGRPFEVPGDEEARFDQPPTVSLRFDVKEIEPTAQDRSRARR